MSGDRLISGLRENTPWRARNSASILKKQAMRFLVIGGASVMVDLSVYLALLPIMDGGYAKGISYVAGMFLGFVGNKLWTFESHKKSLAEPALYAVLYACTLFVNISLNSLAFGVFATLFSADHICYIAAFVVATAVTTILNFVSLKYLAFRQPAPEAI